MGRNSQVLSKVDDLSRPTVTVKIPDMTLTMEDLAYLRSLTHEKSLRCTPGYKVLNKLRFLDLIARAKVAPPKELQQRIAKETKKLKADITTCVKAERWGETYDLSYKLRKLHDSLAPTEDDVLTEKGKEVLRTGTVAVRVRKVGCVA